MATSRVPLVASAAAVTSGVLWSFGAIAVRLADEADAFQYLLWRSVGIIVVIEVIARYRNRPAVMPQAFRSGRTMFVATVMLLTASLAFVYAVKATTAANAAFLASMTPLVAMIGSRIILGERLTRGTLVAIGVATMGLVIMVWGDIGAGNMAGNVAAVMSSVGFAGYTICLRTNPYRDWSPVMPGYGLLMIVICGAITVSHGRSIQVPAADVGYALFHGAVFIVGGTMLFNYAARRVPAVALAVFAQAEMVFVPVWAYLILSESAKRTTLIGGSIIFASVIGKAVADSLAGGERAEQPDLQPIT